MFCTFLPVLPSVLESETIWAYVSAIFNIYGWLFAKLLSLVHLGRCWNQKVKGQGHIIAAEASSTRRCCRVQVSITRLEKYLTIYEY